jgi:SAM-dependent methyltransferase
VNAAFLAIHSDIPREGPGDRDTLDWALAQAGVARHARILDAGCGPGADVAGLLAHAPAGHVVAMETHAPYVARVRAAFAGDPRVTVLDGDMARPPGRFDLIWSAGAVYFLGITAALTGWRDHLAPGGAVVFSELAWCVADPAPAAVAFWAKGYPAMTDADGVAAQVAAAGYAMVAQRWLGAAAWDAYYGPLAARIAALRAGADADMAAALEAEQAEIDLWRAHGGDYGYLQVVARPA